MYDNNYASFKQTYCDPPLFTVIFTVILESKNRPGEYFCRFGKIKAMPIQIFSSLGFMPCILHILTMAISLLICQENKDLGGRTPAHRGKRKEYDQIITAAGKGAFIYHIVALICQIRFQQNIPYVS